MKKAKPTFIDLFAGAGGLSIGIEQAGFDLVAATDWDSWSCQTLRQNHKNIPVVEGDITEIDLDEFSEQIGSKTVDLIVGGPPCQGFSQLGKRDKDDPRNHLWQEYMRFVEYFQPKVFVMENVPQLLTSQQFEDVIATAESLGYEVSAKVLHAVDYGVPQKRKRAVIIGSRIGKILHPDPTHVDPEKITLLNSDLERWRTVRDAIGDLSLEPTETDWHLSRNPTELSLKRYKSIPPGGNRFDLPLELMPDCWKNKPTGSTDVFGRLEWDKPSLTIRTEFYKPEKGKYLHPKAHRPITIREAARLQMFPDNYTFVGSNVQVAKQIGNAVPVGLAHAIGKHIKESLELLPYDFQNDSIDCLTALQTGTR